MSDSNFSLREKSNWRSELKARLSLARRDETSGRKVAEGTLLGKLDQWLASYPGIWLSFCGFSFEPRLALSGSRAHSFAFPKILQDQAIDQKPRQQLSFFRWTGQQQPDVGDWETNRFGIQEPRNAEANWIGIGAQDPVVGALVPALGFDRQLRRLGRGRGFYDRFLSSFDEQRKQLGESPIFKIGIGFSEQLVDELPQDDHDVKLDAVLTDRELIVRCSAARFAD